MKVVFIFFLVTAHHSVFATPKKCNIHNYKDFIKLRRYHVFCNLSQSDLRKANLYKANLRKANLRLANLTGVDLRGAFLHKADLREVKGRVANFSGADLARAKLQGADLRGANLQEAFLRGAELHGANLQGADLRGADLLRAKLHGAKLHGANLQGVDLRETYFEAADLIDTDLRGAIVTPKQAEMLKEFGRKGFIIKGHKRYDIQADRKHLPYRVVGKGCYPHEFCKPITSGLLKGYSVKSNISLTDKRQPRIRPNMFTRPVLMDFVNKKVKEACGANKTPIRPEDLTVPEGTYSGQGFGGSSGGSSGGGVSGSTR